MRNRLAQTVDTSEEPKKEQFNCSAKLRDGEVPGLCVLRRHSCNDAGVRNSIPSHELLAAKGSGESRGRHLEEEEYMYSK